MKHIIKFWLLITSIIFITACVGNGSNSNTPPIESNIIAPPPLTITDGTLKIDLSTNSILLNQTTTATITLLGSENVSSFVVNLSTNNSILSLNQNSCELSSTNNQCTITATGIADGSANIVATVPSKGSISSDYIDVNQPNLQNFSYSLLGVVNDVWGTAESYNGVYIFSTYNSSQTDAKITITTPTIQNNTTFTFSSNNINLLYFEPGSQISSAESCTMENTNTCQVTLYTNESNGVTDYLTINSPNFHSQVVNIQTSSGSLYTPSGGLSGCNNSLQNTICLDRGDGFSVIPINLQYSNISDPNWYVPVTATVVDYTAPIVITQNTCNLYSNLVNSSSIPYSCTNGAITQGGGIITIKYHNE